jgi:hypothetical protein
MLKTGISLLSASTIGVGYRIADLAYSMNPLLKWFCLFGLTIALSCFVATYISAEAPRLRKYLLRQPHMIKSSAWKLSSLTSE